ncbi:MAG: DUF72 domain-containing protein [Candidatus Solibacter sp.]|nr:DUF72 domain-containing protein [Candidatus Solibacter sp.]
MGGSSNLNLFDQQGGPRSALAARLAALAGQGIYFGTSSWKYEGWMGQIYSAERYATRGRFSRKKFEAGCLAEYAETFPAVCGDFSFYQFPSAAYWERLFAGVPAGLKFAFKVPEEITVRTWPAHARYGQRAGKENEGFLDAGLFGELFLRLLEPYRERVGALIFEFGTFSKRQYEAGAAFAEDLGGFLDQLPGGWRYSVEIRNKEFLEPGYFDALRRRNTAHVFNSWTRMPELGEQAAMGEAYTADFLVSRALLSHGRTYEQAVERFQPYDRVQIENPGARDALRKLAERARTEGRMAFLFVNNRLEGNAPGTVEAVAGSLR